MSGYLSFHGATPAIQAVADAINTAGTAYHHTRQWCDEDDYIGGKTHHEVIQAALDALAEAHQAEVARLTRELAGAYELLHKTEDEKMRLTRERDEWQTVLWAVARELNCLPSTFSDGNAHVLKAAIKLTRENEGLAKDAARYAWLRGGMHVRHDKELRSRGGRTINRNETQALASFNFWCTPEELDTAIDRAALAGASGAQEGRADVSSLWRLEGGAVPESQYKDAPGAQAYRDANHG